MIITESEAKEISQILEGLASDPRVLSMTKVKQHKNTTTYDHVVNVVAMCYILNKRLRINQDIRQLIIGAFLHDYFLYDWRENDIGMQGFRHGFAHPSIAMQNATRDFNINSKVKNIIYQHMWPYTPTQLPKCREAWIVVMADKICAIRELLSKKSIYLVIPENIENVNYLQSKPNIKLVTYLRETKAA